MLSLMKASPIGTFKVVYSVSDPMLGQSRSGQSGVDPLQRSVERRTTLAEQVRLGQLENSMKDKPKREGTQ